MSSKSENLLYADIANGTGGSGGSNPDYPDAPSYPGEGGDDGGSGGGDDGPIMNHKLMTSKSGRIIHEGLTPGERVVIIWWWDFNQDDAVSPAAYVNGTMVCPGHSTTHIAAYNVGNVRNKKRATITMKLRRAGTEKFKGGAPCMHRIWLDNGNYLPSGFYKQKPSLRAQRGGSIAGGATFTISISSKGKITFS